MTDSTFTAASEREEARRLGRALSILRTRVGLTREAAGLKMGLGPEAWAKYERGDAPGIFRPGVQERLTAALGQSVKDLTDEVARVIAAAVQDYPGMPDARP